MCYERRIENMASIQLNELSLRLDAWIKQHWTKPCPFCGAEGKWRAEGPFHLEGFGTDRDVALVACRECAAGVPLFLVMAFGPEWEKPPSAKSETEK
jgi:hypothetical protein